MGNRNRLIGSVGDVQSVMPLLDYRHRYHQAAEINNTADEVMRASGKMLFTATQWQELEMQTVIYKYIMASIPVPPQLLFPLSTQSNRVSMGLRFSNGSDPEAWRCRRTDGKKWRCSKDVAPDQKYCDRHARKNRSRSRKPVENAKDYPTVLSAARRQTECIDQWFLKNAGTPVYESNNQLQQPMHSPIGVSKRGSSLKQECALTLSMQSGGNETEFDNGSYQMAVGMLSGDRGECEDVFKPHPHWLNQASWSCLGSGSGSGSGSTPGGPLGEALCLGVTSTRNKQSSGGYSYSTTATSSHEGGGLNFVSRQDG